jgi:hypothetical protein
VPIEDVAPETQEAAGEAPEPMEVAPEKPPRRLEEKEMTRCQTPLWRWSSARQRSRTRSQSARCHCLC